MSIGGCDSNSSDDGGDDQNEITEDTITLANASGRADFDFQVTFPDGTMKTYDVGNDAPINGRVKIKTDFVVGQTFTFSSSVPDGSIISGGPITCTVTQQNVDTHTATVQSFPNSSTGTALVMNCVYGWLMN
jgi:hypothetical protein